MWTDCYLSWPLDIDVSVVKALAKVQLLNCNVATSQHLCICSDCMDFMSHTNLFLT